MEKSIDKLYLEFQKSVETLSGKLPQWQPNNEDRLKQSVISSLFEELGELCGLVSKYRTRRHYWNIKPKDLSTEDFNKIREKFVDETGDFLWVLVCSIKNIWINLNDINILKELTECPIYDVSFEQALFDIIRDVSIFRQNLLFIENITDVSKRDVIDILNSFGIYLSKLNEEYGITFSEIITYNMNKLNNRYTNSGERKDGN